MTDQSTWDLLGSTTASSLLICLLFELMFIFKNLNKIYKKSTKELDSSEQVFSEVFFGSLDKQTLKRTWFVGNYEILHLIRYLGMVLFLFNLQYLQVLQVAFPLLLVVGYAVLTYYYQISHGIFESRSESVFKLILEASMSIMMLIVCVFCLDSFKHVLSRTGKNILAYSFIGLLSLNIALELIMSLVTSICYIIEVASWCRNKRLEARIKQEKRQRKSIKGVPTSSQLPPNEPQVLPMRDRAGAQPRADLPFKRSKIGKTGGRARIGLGLQYFGRMRKKVKQNNQMIKKTQKEQISFKKAGTQPFEGGKVQKSKNSKIEHNQRDFEMSISLKNQRLENEDIWFLGA